MPYSYCSFRTVGDAGPYQIFRLILLRMILFQKITPQQMVIYYAVKYL